MGEALKTRRGGGASTTTSQTFAPIQASGGTITNVTIDGRP
jgi:hypothetical protein